MTKKMGGGGGIMGVGKSNAKVYMQKKTGITFADVAGVDEAKESLVELVDFLHNPADFASITDRIDALFYGLFPERIPFDYDE